MSRSKMLRLILVLLGLSLVVGLAPGPLAASPPLAAGPPQRYCFRWGFLNNTGLDADDLHVRLQGTVDLGVTFSVPFGRPAAGSGYDPATNTTLLNFAGSMAPNGAEAEVALCTRQPALRMGARGAEPPLQWTQRGAAIAPAPLFLGLTWTWLGPGRLRLTVHNDGQEALLLWQIAVADPGSPVGLEDLTADMVEALPPVALAPEEPLSLEPGNSVAVTVAYPVHGAGAVAKDVASVAGNRPLVVAAMASTVDDPGNVVNLYSEGLSPWPLFLPMLMKS